MSKLRPSRRVFLSKLRIWPPKPPNFVQTLCPASKEKKEDEARVGGLEVGASEEAQGGGDTPWIDIDHHLSPVTQPIPRILFFLIITIGGIS